MMCQWCDNPKDLLEDSYANYCFRCHRHTRPIPENLPPPPEYISDQGYFNPLEYLDHHACIWEYTTNPLIPNLYFLKCINPVRAEKSSNFDPVGKKCRKYFSINKAEYDADEEKRKLARIGYSYEWFEEQKANWEKIDEVKRKKEEEAKARRPPLKVITQEDYKDDPQYQVFLKLKEKAKSGGKPKV